MSSLKDVFAAASNIILFLSALHASHKLFKEHRAPAVGFLLIACSAGVSSLSVSYPALTPICNDLDWAGQALGPALATFGFLWLSEDTCTALLLLIGSSLLPVLADWLSQDALVLMSRCSALSSLSCSLTVCLFAGNVAGVVGSVALCLPLLLTPRASMALSIVSPEVAGGLLKALLRGSMAVGCWATRIALHKYLLDLKGWD